MLGRDEIFEIVQQTFSDVLGVSETDVTLDASLQSDLGLDADEFEDMAARLQATLDIHITPDELFPDETADQLTVEFVVGAIERRL